MFSSLAMVLSTVVQVVVLAIIIRAVLSFFPQIDRSHPLVRAIDTVVEPVLAPFRRVLPPMGGFDLSPIVAILTLQLLRDLVVGMLLNLGAGF